MMKNRLQEFRKLANLKSSFKSNGEVRIDIACSNENKELVEHDKDLAVFLSHMQLLNDRITRMEETLKHIHELQDMILNDPFEDLNFIRDYTDVVKMFRNNLYSVNNELKEFINGLTTLQENGNSSDRIRKNQILAANKKFYNLIVDFNDDQAKYMEISDKITKAYKKITGVHKKYDDLKEAVDDGEIFDGKTRNFKLHRQNTNACSDEEINRIASIARDYVNIGKDIEYTKVDAEVSYEILPKQDPEEFAKFEDLEDKEKKLIVDEVKDRNKEIFKVESNVKELYNLFNDLEMIIKSQEELMNNIETNVNFAVEYTEKAEENLEKVESAKNKNIKLKFSALFAVILLAFLLYFIGTAVVCFYVPVLCKN